MMDRIPHNLLHDKELVSRIWRSDRIEETKRTKNTDAGRKGLWGYLARLRNDIGGEKVVVGYKACGLGYTIYDEAIDMGFTCYVLATIKMAKSPDGRETEDGRVRCGKNKRASAVP
jgi:hypothetical protein